MGRVIAGRMLSVLGDAMPLTGKIARHREHITDATGNMLGFAGRFHVP